jgi:hypothetical protein
LPALATTDSLPHARTQCNDSAPRTVSGAAAAVRADFFGTDNISFTLPSQNLALPARSYSSFFQAAAESAVSRLFPQGETFTLMFMWDFAEGRTDPHVVLWVDTPFGFMPFLNEGIMMANVRFGR